MDTCKVEGCSAPVKVKKEQLCGRHYVRFRRYGDVETNKRRPKSVCSVDGCTFSVAAQGLCDTHYRRQRRYGTTDAPERPTVCVVPDCVSPVQANGLCDRHYRQERSGTLGSRYCRQCGSELPMEAHKNRKFCSNECLRMSISVSQRETGRESQLRIYGLTVDQYDAMLAAQDGVCAICKSPDPNGRSGSTYFVVDHDHATGDVRGLLCAPCNSGIGLLQDSIIVIEQALEYLRAHTS